MTFIFYLQHLGQEEGEWQRRKVLPCYCLGWKGNREEWISLGGVQKLWQRFWPTSVTALQGCGFPLPLRSKQWSDLHNGGCDPHTISCPVGSSGPIILHFKSLKCRSSKFFFCKRCFISKTITKSLSILERKNIELKNQMTTIFDEKT